LSARAAKTRRRDVTPGMTWSVPMRPPGSLMSNGSFVKLVNDCFRAGGTCLLSGQQQIALRVDSPLRLVQGCGRSSVSDQRSKWGKESGQRKGLPQKPLRRLQRLLIRDCASCYFPANSRLTASLTIFPSTRTSAAEKRAITFFITVPISFIVGDPISAITAFTPATTWSSPADCGR
jgi:hypothetical protein